MNFFTFLNHARRSYNAMILLCILFFSSQVTAFRFVIYADCRAPKGDPSLFNHAILGYINSQVVALNPDFVFFLGDMVNRAVTPDYSHSNLVDWLAFMRSTLGTIPLYTAVGNSDLYGNTGWIEYPLQGVYQSVFSFLPNNGPTNYKQLAYSFEFGQGKDRSLFVVLDAFGFTNIQGTWVGFDNGYDTEQINWFEQQASSSTAPNKFVLTHGPAFSVEGFPVQSSVNDVWNIVQTFNFDMFYCAHEHIYSRWATGSTVLSGGIRKLMQVIVGSSGAPLDNPANVVVNPQQAHIYSGYTFVVVDVNNGTFVQRAYKVLSDGSGGFITQNLDNLIIS